MTYGDCKTNKLICNIAQSFWHREPILRQWQALFATFSLQINSYNMAFWRFKFFAELCLRYGNVLSQHCSQLTFSLLLPGKVVYLYDHVWSHLFCKSAWLSLFSTQNRQNHFKGSLGSFRLGTNLIKSHVSWTFPFKYEIIDVILCNL